RVGVLVAARRVWIRDEDRGLAGRGELEHRSARAREDQIAGRQRVGEAALVVEQRVAGRAARVLVRAQRHRVIARTGDVQDVEVAPGGVQQALQRGRVQ